MTTWIKCSDRLPEEDGDYLTVTQNRVHRWIALTPFKKGGWSQVYIDWTKVSHWMPLPELPEE